MMLSKKKVCLMGIIVVLGILALTITTCMADDVKCQVFFPAAGIISGTPFNITVKAYNSSANPIAFNRVVVAYLNPDLTVKGPYVFNISRTVNPGPTPLSFNFSFTITTNQPTGSLVPVAVTLWSTHYTSGYSRGAGAGAAKVQ